MANGNPLPRLPHAWQAADELADRPTAFYNALLTEHFVLESARGITVSESSSRASLYLMTLSSSLVAFGFLAQTPIAFGFLGVIIPVVFLLGIFTYERLVETSLEDVVALASIQRIRRFYSTLLPGADEYFPRPVEGRAPNELLEIGRNDSWRNIFFTTSTAVAVVNSIVAGAGIALALDVLAFTGQQAILTGVVTAAVMSVLHGVYQRHRYTIVKRLIYTQDAVTLLRSAGDNDD
ncbi:hypothetical protein ABIE21_003640 [Conyzicola nivalis]|uniref:Uncharacterized protein n=1 Tax=Conyzicola nivalis TaxID=1477021 RepID=A0ABV2QSQ0_9MICO